MPRLLGYRERIPHDFAFVVDLEPGERQSLFRAGQELAPGMMEVCKILRDARLEKRSNEEQKILDELAKMSRGMLYAINVPVKMPLTAHIKLLSKHPGTAMVHLRTVITREIQ